MLAGALVAVCGLCIVVTLTTTTTSETVHVEQVVVTTTSETQPVVNTLSHHVCAV